MRSAAGQQHTLKLQHKCQQHDNHVQRQKVYIQYTQLWERIGESTADDSQFTHGWIFAEDVCIELMKSQNTAVYRYYGILESVYYRRAFPYTAHPYPKHPIFDILYRLSYLQTEWRFSNLIRRLTQQVLAHGWQTILESGMVRSHKPFKFWLAPTKSLEQLIVSGAVKLVRRWVS